MADDYGTFKSLDGRNVRIEELSGPPDHLELKRMADARAEKLAGLMRAEGKSLNLGIGQANHGADDQSLALAEGQFAGRMQRNLARLMQSSETEEDPWL